MTKNWYPAVNGFRGILAFLIIMLHFEGMYIGRQKYFETGYLAVDCFFLISGFFLMQQLMSSSQSDINPVKITWQKIKKIYPLYIFMILFAVIICLIFPVFKTHITIRPDMLISEILLMSCSFGAVELINGVNWFVSALILSTFFIVLFYKSFPRVYVNIIAPISILVIYSLFMVKTGSLDNHLNTIGCFRAGLLRGFAGMSLGCLVCFFHLKYRDFLTSFKFLNYCETMLAVALFLLCIGNKHSNLDFILPFCAGGFLLCILQQSGAVADVLKWRIFQELGNISMSIFLSQFVVIYWFMIYLPQFATNRVLSTSLFVIIELLFAWLLDLLINKKAILVICKRLIKLPYFEYVGLGLIITLFFIMQGSNIWAETVAEYQRYIYDTSFSESFGGYITVFPIIVAFVYRCILGTTSISWYDFASFISLVYVLLCVSAILYVFKKNNTPKISHCLIWLALMGSLVHPSVNSIINITHLGYVPIIIYVILTLFNGNIIDDIKNIPIITLIPLVLAALSKPSFFCLTFLLIALLTKLWQKPIKFFIIIGAAIISCLQLLLFSGGGSPLALSVLGSVTGLFKFILVFIEIIGGALVFPVVYFYDGQIPNAVVAASACLGIMLIYIAVKAIKTNCKGKNVIVSGIILLSVVMACVMPYVVHDYSLSFGTVLAQSLTDCFSKHKLQYQLISTVILLTIFIASLNIFLHNKPKEVIYKQFAFVVMAIALLNGMACGLYSSHWQTVHIVKNDSFKYTNSQPFIYPPYTDWDWGWNDSVSGWVKGEKYIGFLTKPQTNGDCFRDKNEEPIPSDISDNAKIYLYLSDASMGSLSATNYWEYFIKKNNATEFSIDNYIVEFSSATYNNVRYAVIDYTTEFYEILKKENTIIAEVTNPDNVLTAGHLNFVIVY